MPGRAGFSFAEYSLEEGYYSQLRIKVSHYDYDYDLIEGSI